MKEDIEQIELYISHTLCHPINNGALISLYYRIGSYLCNHHILVSTLKILEWEIKSQYGIVIGFTKRNFIFMMHFYRTYSKSNLAYLKWISWHQHLYLLNKNQRKFVLMKYSVCKKIKCRKKCISFIKIDYMLTEMQKLQQKL